MKIDLNSSRFIDFGLSVKDSERLIAEINILATDFDDVSLFWSKLSQKLYQDQIPFDVHLEIFTQIFPKWHTHPSSAPAWIPDQALIAEANIMQFMQAYGFQDVTSFQNWTFENFSVFWQAIIDKLVIPFDVQPTSICDLSEGVISPHWLPGAQYNIANACFKAEPNQIAIVNYKPDGSLLKVSYNELNHLSDQIAYSLEQQGYQPGDAIAIAMPMNHLAIAIYLGIIKMGGVVVSIADSFSADEMAIRLRISSAKAIFTQDNILWNGKELPLYSKISSAIESIDFPIQAIVCSLAEECKVILTANSITWNSFLRQVDFFEPKVLSAMSPCNILFSSGTTAEPKAIIWNHSTPIKVGSDAFFHQNIKQGDVLAWPTNLGWMMGPWLIFASLMNSATLALYTDAPKTREFGKFIEIAEVTMLGLVPTLVASWRQSRCMEGLDWSKIKIFSSTGECSNSEDMFYLMWLGGYKPIIEYCGGTEIGGSYISSTVIQPNYPSLFTTKAMGMNFIILDEQGELSDMGEVAIVPPSIGLSTQLLNADHKKIYFDDMPHVAGYSVLRRHGDQLQRLHDNYFSILGRIDDTMNLGGIKTSSVEIERVLSLVPNVIETAAISVLPPRSGPSQLVIFAKLSCEMNGDELHKIMQAYLNKNLNPLFRIHKVFIVTDLPKTASNKIMRRVLKKDYFSSIGS